MATSKRTSARARQAPWEHEAPVKSARKKPKTLTPAQKAHAKQRARKAGRPYPNLVDNMHEVASAQPNKRAPRKKATTRRGSSAQSSEPASKRTPANKSASATGGTSRRTSTTRTTTTRKAPARKRATRKTSARKSASVAGGERNPKTKRAAPAVASEGQRRLARVRSAKAR